MASNSAGTVTCLATLHIDGESNLLQGQHLNSHQAEAPSKIKPSSVYWFAYWFSLVAH